MKRKGIINKQLAGALAALGHKDTFMICDAGMPIPKEIEIIDLALCGGVPTFRQVMDAVLEEAGVEEYFLAEEIKTNNPELLSYIENKLEGIPGNFVAHEPDFKAMTHNIKFAIRTGEFSTYPNIILKAYCCFA